MGLGARIQAALAERRATAALNDLVDNPGDTCPQRRQEILRAHQNSVRQAQRNRAETRRGGRR